MDKLAGPSGNIHFQTMRTGHSKGCQSQCAVHFYILHFLTNFSTNSQFFTNVWSTYSKLNPSTVTMVVFCNNMEGGSLFMKVFLGVNIITSLLNMSVAGGKR